MPLLTASCLTPESKTQEMACTAPHTSPLAFGLRSTLAPCSPLPSHTSRLSTPGKLIRLFLLDVYRYTCIAPLPHLLPVFAQTSAESPLTALFNLSSKVPTAGTLHHLLLVLYSSHCLMAFYHLSFICDAYFFQQLNIYEN